MTAFDHLYLQPSGDLGPPLLELRLEGVTAALHVEAGDGLWARVLTDRPRFSRIGDAALVVGRAAQDGPFVLAGAFAQPPAGLRSVHVECNAQKHEASTSDAGWLCLLPATSAPFPLRVALIDGELRETLDHPSLTHVGTIGPTFYVPRVRASN